MHEMNLTKWLEVDESASTLLARILTRRVPPLTSVPPLHRVALNAGHVLEIVGPSGSGKSELLLQAAVACILPKQRDGVTYGGSEGVVMMFDLDCRFDMLRLVNVLQLRINEARAAAVRGAASNDEQQFSQEEDDVFMSCLRRFFYIRCNNSFDFLSALKTLHAKIKRLNEDDIKAYMLMVDSINAFYWLDRAISSMALSGQGAGRTALSLQVVFEAVVRELNQLLQIHPLLILATKSLIYSHNLRDRKSADNSKDILPEEIVEQNPDRMFDQTISKDGRAVPREFMPAVWQGFVSHRLVLQGPFQPGGSQNSCGENLPFFTAAWETPYLNHMDKLIIEDRGIKLKD